MLFTTLSCVFSLRIDPKETVIAQTGIFPTSKEIKSKLDGTAYYYLLAFVLSRNAILELE